MPALRTVAPLSPEKLRPCWPADRIPWEDSRAIPRTKRRRPAQPRALAALELALHVRTSGYNVFVSGSPDLGRTYMLTEFLEPLARKQPTPPDIIYVHGFSDEDRPVLIQLPAGQGRVLKKDLAEALRQIRKCLPSLLESESYLSKRAEALEQFRKERSIIISEMEKKAIERGFVLEMDEQGVMNTIPMVDGRRITAEEMKDLKQEDRKKFKQEGDLLIQYLAAYLRRVNKLEKSFQDIEKELERDAAAELLDHYIAPVSEKSCRLAGCGEKDDALSTFFAALREDMLDHLEVFVPRDYGQASSEPTPEGDLTRYDVNLLVDNSQLTGAPVVVEHNPTYGNLLGCIERESEMGALITDFTLLKAGALHRANGGYLILRALDLLRSPMAWEGFMRALRSNLVRIEDPDVDTIRVKSLEPAPMPLNVKVILVGDEELYEKVLFLDERFSKLFKIKAQMNSETERTAPQVRAWLGQLARVMDDAELLPFGRDALAGLVDHGSELCEDHRKLTLRFPLMRETLVEASAMASMQGKEMVDREALDAALKARRNRFDLVEEMYREEYDRDVIKIHCTGEAVGRANGLAVTSSGDYEFGLPHQISCTVGVGQGGIVDLEREAELSGPIHTKAILILKSYLASQFAHNKPLVLSGS
ncbi:MAG: AAA family ATPase, partial [Mailhella sp.]|nr:AAA family ATPase [Mailhella sp.]